MLMSLVPATPVASPPSECTSTMTRERSYCLRSSLEISSDRSSSIIVVPSRGLRLRAAYDETRWKQLVLRPAPAPDDNPLCQPRKQMPPSCVIGGRTASDELTLKSCA